jgi:hypothetical protein
MPQGGRPGGGEHRTRLLAMKWDQEQLKAKLAELELEHRDLDDVINNLMNKSDFDQIKVGRLKKRKLALKDQITALRGRLIPDIIA